MPVRLLLVALTLAVAAASPLQAQGTGAAVLEESILRGEAEVARGKANYNYLSAEASKSLEQARSLNIDSRKKGLNNYFETRQQNKDATLGQIKRFSKEQMAAIAKKEAPDRMPATDYEPMSGRLKWPTPLTTPDFAAHREAVNQLFKRRGPKDVTPETEFHATIRELTDEMQEMLFGQIDKLPPMEYSSSHKFLRCLEHEAQLSPSTDDVTGVPSQPAGR
jgi:hypothetical protein